MQNMSICIKGHVLSEQEHGQMSWDCDKCNKNITTDEHFYGCRKCNYDLCSDCFEDNKPKVPKLPLPKFNINHIPYYPEYLQPNASLPISINTAPISGNIASHSVPRQSIPMPSKKRHITELSNAPKNNNNKRSRFDTKTTTNKSTKTNPNGNTTKRKYNCETSVSKLEQFLSACLPNQLYVQQIKNKLDAEGVDHSTLFKLGADDIRVTFKDLAIKPWLTGLIISGLYEMDGSGVQKQPSQTEQFSVVVLNAEQNEYILELNGNTQNVQNNIANLEQAQIDINKTADDIAAEIQQYYQQLQHMLILRKNETLKKLDKIKNRKSTLLIDQTTNAIRTLTHLQNSNHNLTQIIKDSKLDVVQKQYAVTQLIESSQHSLLKYGLYLKDNMPFITQPNIKYETQSNQSFKQLIEDIDDVLDTDINFIKIEFIDCQIIMEWDSDLNRLKDDVQFNLEFKLANSNSTNKWNMLQPIHVNQTKINLNKTQVQLLKELTLYRFRIQMRLSQNSIYSQILNVKTKEFYALNSSIITHSEEKQLIQWFSEGRKSTNTKFELLFRGSRDGFGSSTFHSKCDNKGSTLIIVRSEHNHVFGGYTTKSWNHVFGGYIRDDDAWIYLLRSSKNDTPQKWKSTKAPQSAIYCNNGYGPTFGGGHDLHVTNGCNSNTNSYSNLGNSYSASSDQSKLAGSYKFKVIDYEVWQLIV